MYRKLVPLLIFVSSLTACSNTNKSNANRYLKLAEFEDGEKVAFIDSKTEEIIFLDLYGHKIEKRLSIK